MVRVGLTGGIGSGKSTVARALEALGVPVYYTDPRARELMAEDPRIVAEMTALLGLETYRDGAPNKQFIASKIFNDKGLLAQVNAIVHPRVAEDFEGWSAEMRPGASEGRASVSEAASRAWGGSGTRGFPRKSQPHAQAPAQNTVGDGLCHCPSDLPLITPPYIVLECAILFESGFERLVDYVVTVAAPVGERVARAAARDGVDERQVRSRMAHQMDDAERAARADFELPNSDRDMVLPRILELHNFFCDEG